MVGIQSHKDEKRFKGLLLVNLGTPDSPRLRDVWRYLNEFLTDERVIDLPWWRRQLLVRGLIVPLRVRNSAQLYRGLWTAEGSPLLFHSRAMATQLQVRLGSKWQVELAMRYGNPSIAEGLSKLQFCSEMVVLPLFPQYASATSGSVIAAVMQELSFWPAIPPLHLLGPFYNHPSYIHALSDRAGNFALKTYDKVLFSFHGLPVREKTAAFYGEQCQATAQLLAKELNLAPSSWMLAYQSRLGRDPWLEPYATDALKKLRQEGAKRILVFSPAFVADCLETIQEIGTEYAAEFRHLGGEALDLVPCLNSSPRWIDTLEQLVVKIPTLLT